MYGLEVQKLGKAFVRDGQVRPVLQGVSLALEPGKTLAVVGESGSGKTTLVRLLAGLLAPDHGSVVLRDEAGEPVAAQAARTMLMFQEPRLLPWLTVRQNLALSSHGPLWPHGSEPRTRDRLIDQQLEFLGLRGWGDSFPSQLSGGMAQRVAIGRTLLPDPGLVLMDEPFGALDSLTRRRLQDELAGVLSARRQTMVLVTHDLGEALFLADRVAVLRRGCLVDLRENPRKGARSEEKDPLERGLLKSIGGIE